MSPSGQERSKTFDRKVDAERYAVTVESDKSHGQYVDPRLGGVRFADFVDRQYRPTMIDLEATTKARDESYLRTHILPTFGSVPLANIEESEDVYLTPAQVRDLAEAMEEVAPRYRALVFVGCYSGPRIGELAALRWNDIDMLQRTVQITKKVVEVTGHGLMEGSTKTKAGRRTVTIPRLVVDEIDRHRMQFPSTPLVFTSPNGAQVRANNLRRRAWARAVELAGLKPVPTFHDMRHTAVSLWIAAGATDLEVAKWAGHGR